MVVWQPLPLEGKLDHMMPRASPGIVPYCAGLPDVQAHCGRACARHTLSLVDSLVLVWLMLHSSCELVP